jgi:SNF2 family DNA or RNA helicase
MLFKPEPYQTEVRDFLLQHERSYLNVGLGLGKTASTLSALHSLFLEGEIRAALIVAPKRVARVTWPNEIEKWDQFRWMKYEVLAGQKPSGKAQIYLINYDRLQQLEDLRFCDVVIFDEITKLKNHASKRAKALRPKLKHHRRWGLTGTPRPNSLMELFGQVRMLDDGKRLGAAFTGFRDGYFYPTDYMRYNWAPKPQSEEKIYQRIADITLTLRSSDYLDVPDTILTDIEVPLPQSVEKQYSELEKQFLLATKGGEVVARNAATLVGKLHQICGGAVYNDDKTVEELHTDKIEALRKIIGEIGEPVLVACNYIHERERICRAISFAVDASKVKGDIEAAWNGGGMTALVCDPRSLGHGLNLQQGGRTIVWYSPTWSRENYDQFNARVARKGQDKVPQIYRLICPNTIDEAIIETLRERGDAQHEMMRVMSNYRKLII